MRNYLWQERNPLGFSDPRGKLVIRHEHGSPYGGNGWILVAEGSIEDILFVQKKIEEACKGQKGENNE